MKDYLKVSISGVRGVVGDSFTPQVAVAFAQAFGSLVGQGIVVVGRDTRPSGSMIERAIAAGLQSVGCKPVMAGIVPTPTLLMLTTELGARGGICITASHNPSQWNAMKFVDRTGLFLTPHRAEELFDTYHQGDYRFVPETDIPQIEQEADPMRHHFNKIYKYIDVTAIKSRKFKVAVDCCNGVGAIHTRRFLESLGCEVFTCFDDPSGAFEREPEPLPENLKALSKLVKEKKCAIGFAQDPDGDRLAIVNEHGEPIGEDLTVAFAVRQVLDHHEKGPVAIHLSTSRCVRDVAEERGSKVTLTKIGEINVSQTMIEIKAVVGGEGNGGVIIPAVHPCRDSYIGMAIVLELMAMSGKTVSKLRSEIPSYEMVKDKITIRADVVSDILRSLRSAYQDEKIHLLDGVLVEFADKWVHVRRSNTEPVVRITVEARNRKIAEETAKEFRAKIESMAGKK